MQQFHSIRPRINNSSTLTTIQELIGVAIVLGTMYVAIWAAYIVFN